MRQPHSKFSIDVRPRPELNMGLSATALRHSQPPPSRLNDESTPNSDMAVNTRVKL